MLTMTRNEFESLKAKIRTEERLYLTELKTLQRFDVLKAIRLRLNLLNEKASAYKQNKP